MPNGSTSAAQVPLQRTAAATTTLPTPPPTTTTTTSTPTARGAGGGTQQPRGSSATGGEGEQQPRGRCDREVIDAAAGAQQPRGSSATGGEGAQRGRCAREVMDAADGAQQPRGRHSREVNGAAGGAHNSRGGAALVASCRGRRSHVWVHERGQGRLLHCEGSPSSLRHAMLRQPVSPAVGHAAPACLICGVPCCASLSRSRRCCGPSASRSLQFPYVLGGQMPGRCWWTDRGGMPGRCWWTDRGGMPGRRTDAWQVPGRRTDARQVLVDRGMPGRCWWTEEGCLAGARQVLANKLSVSQDRQREEAGQTERVKPQHLHVYTR
eukprot:349640-Chlamydomonas_euryale.AAC.5